MPKTPSDATPNVVEIENGEKIKHPLALLLLNVKQGSNEYQFLDRGLTRPGIEPESTVSVAKPSIKAIAD